MPRRRIRAIKTRVEPIRSMDPARPGLRWARTPSRTTSYGAPPGRTRPLSRMPSAVLIARSDAGAHLAHRLVDVLYSAPAVAFLVMRGSVKLGASVLQVGKRLLHMGLIHLRRRGCGISSERNSEHRRDCALAVGGHVSSVQHGLRRNKHLCLNSP